MTKKTSKVMPVLRQIFGWTALPEQDRPRLVAIAVHAPNGKQFRLMSRASYSTMTTNVDLPEIVALNLARAIASECGFQLVTRT